MPSATHNAKERNQTMSSEDKKHRSHLPIATPERTGLITYDARDPDTRFPPIEQLRPPKGAPNVLLILLDDAGFGSASAFGGPCQTPNAETLAAGGLKYNRFHDTALCSPTRQALLTGRNHHSAGMGGVTEIATGAPGYSSVLPNTISPLARTLKLNGYSTAQFGKCHEVPVWETSPVGPFDAWPTGGGGFEYFYGFIGGEANQWYPTLYEATTPVEPKKTPEEGYHFMEDMTDKAIAWVAQQKALAPDSASAEGTLNGAYNEMANFNGLAALETPEFLMERYEKLGGPELYNHYAVGWAHAMNTPYQWTKQVASHWGGTRNGTIVHWPNGIKAKGEIRSQFHHVIDVASTILEAAGLPEPVSVNGIQQRPIEGVSMLYSFDDTNAAERHETQYFEMFGNRGIYHKGWTAVTKHGTPWVLVGRKTIPLDEDVWELYDTTKDWSQANNLAKQMPEKLHELQRLWLIEATRYNVLPVDDRVIEKVNPDTAGRPVLIRGTPSCFSPAWDACLRTAS